MILSFVPAVVTGLILAALYLREAKRNERQARLILKLTDELRASGNWKENATLLKKTYDTYVSDDRIKRASVNNLVVKAFEDLDKVKAALEAIKETVRK